MSPQRSEPPTQATLSLALDGEEHLALYAALTGAKRTAEGIEVQGRPAPELVDVLLRRVRATAVSTEFNSDRACVRIELTSQEHAQIVGPAPAVEPDPSEDAAPADDLRSHLIDALTAARAAAERLRQLAQS